MKKLLLVLLVGIIALSGCGGSGSPTANKGEQGSITLNISESGVKAQTIQPGLDMSIATYDIAGSGPNGTSFHKNNVQAGSSVTINALAIGSWTISVDAKNSSGTNIAAGVSQVQVTAGADSTAEVIVQPLDGNGALSLQISWPSGFITNANVAGTLIPQKGGSAINVPFTISGETATCENLTLAAGYYTVQIKLQDGAVDQWGAVDVVRIIAGQISNGRFPLNARPGKTGKIELVVTPDLQNPITITFSGQQENLNIGNDMTVTATTSETVNSYQWYLNGELIPEENGPSITLGSSLEAGCYRLDLVVTKENTISSGSINFTVTDTTRPYKVGAVCSISGPASGYGIPQRDTLLMIQEQVNQTGGINGHPLQLIIEDDATDSTLAVNAVQKLITQDHVCALIGASTTVNTMATVPLAENYGVLQMAMGAGAQITHPLKRWVFRTAAIDYSSADMILAYMSTHSIMKVAILYDSSAIVSSGRNQLQNLASTYQISIVREESYHSWDLDMTTQLNNILTTDAQAIIYWGLNPGASRLALNAQQLGNPLPIYMFHGVADQALIDQSGIAANGIILPSLKLLIANQLPDSDPRKTLLLDYRTQFQLKYNRPTNFFGGHAWDALQLIIRALRQVGDDRNQLRDEMENTHDFYGITGIYNYSAENHDGLSNESLQMVQIVDGQWVIL